jgi:hypothetical protein
MNLPAASCGVSKTSRNEASFGEYNPKRFKNILCPIILASSETTPKEYLKGRGKAYMLLDII